MTAYFDWLFWKENETLHRALDQSVYHMNHNAPLCAMSIMVI